MRLLILTQAVDLEDPILGFFHRWIEEFAKHCKKVTVICLKEGRHDLPSNVTVYSLGKLAQSRSVSGRESFSSRMGYISRFYRFIWTLRYEYDNVFVHMNPEYVVLGGIIWRLVDKPVALWYTHKSVTPYLRIAVWLSRVILTASAESFRISSSKLHIMGHGIPVEDFAEHSPSSGSLRMYTAGRISPTKHTKELIDAAILLKEKGMDVVFTVIGAGVTARERAYETDLKKVYGNRSDVVFLGAIKSALIPEILKEQDLALNASATGSLDKAVLEAFAAGMPAVSSNEAFEDILRPHGLYVESATPTAFASAIEHYIDSENKLEVSAALRQYVQKNHSLSALIPAIVSAY